MRKELLPGCPLTRLDLNEGQLDWLPRNPRQWTQDDIDRMKASILEDPDFVQERPVLAVPSADGKRLIVFAHNLYTRAAKDLKLATAPVVVHYPETDADCETIRRRAMKDNGSLGAWDWDALANEWDDLPLTEWGIPAWPGENGEGAGENGSNDGGSGQHTETHEDKFDANKDGILVRCKPGDIWQLGDHRLCCGDSTDLETVKKLMGGAEARLCVTSPPYGVGKSYEEYGLEPWKKTVYPVIENITQFARIIVWNIGDLFATGTQFIEPTSMLSAKKMKDCGFGMMYARIWKKQGGNFAGTEPYYTVSMKPVQEYEWILGFAKMRYTEDYEPLIQWMAEQARIASLDNDILKEITGAGFMFGHWFTKHQWAMISEENYAKIAAYCKREGIHAFERDYEDLRAEYDRLNIFGKVLSKDDESAWGQWGIWNISTVSKRIGGHPAEFPVELPGRCIKMHSRVGDIILDPFGGSGTTMIAAEQLGRRCYMMEIDHHYCDVILARWEKETGRKAEKIA